MVLAKTGNGIISIRGRSGGVYYKKGRDSQHIQAMPRTVNYNRVGAQMILTSRFTFVAMVWMLKLVAGYALLWAAFALAWLFSKKNKEPKKISGYNWYIHYSMRPASGERPPIVPIEWWIPPPLWKPPPLPAKPPDILVTTQGMYTYRHSPDEWPDTHPSDNYWYWGEWNNKPCYESENRKWVLWWDDTRWAISTHVGQYVQNYTYYSYGINMYDTYLNPDTNEYCDVFIGGPLKVIPD